MRHASFNLVIERLLISGWADAEFRLTRAEVSISLSSGFSFQVINDKGLAAFGIFHVSISLSSGFSFQVTAPAV